VGVLTRNADAFRRIVVDELAIRPGQPPIRDLDDRVWETGGEDERHFDQKALSAARLANLGAEAAIAE
jgi:hypothetical protein